MARAKGNDAYDLDGVSSVDGTNSEAPLPYPMGLGNSDMDGIESVEGDASLTYKGDSAWPSGGKPVSMDSVTEIPGGQDYHRVADQNTWGANCVPQPPGYDPLKK